jgi:hypothetical protein
MGLVMMEGSPFSPMFNGNGGGCVYGVERDAGGNNIDLTNLSPNNNMNSTDIQDAMFNPQSGGTVFDSITQTLERSAESINVFFDIIGGGYITSFIEKTAIGCEYDSNQSSETYKQWIPVYNPVWEGFKSIFHTIIVVLTIITAFYILSGRGFLLSS